MKRLEIRFLVFPYLRCREGVGCSKSRFERTAHCVFEQTRPNPPALPRRADRKSREQHDRYGMTREAPGEALRRIAVFHLADDERVKADYLTAR